MEVGTMTVLFSELLVPGWSEGPEAKIGLREVTSPADTQVDGKNFYLPCHNVDPEIFFAETPALISLAKSLCGDCPVAQKCLSGAISRQEPCGVWGGELFDNGRPVQAKRTPGRPRLQPVASSSSKEPSELEIAREHSAERKLSGIRQSEVLAEMEELVSA